MTIRKLCDWYYSVKHFLDKRPLRLRIAVEKGRPVALLAALALLKQSADGVATKQAGRRSPRHPWMFFPKEFRFRLFGPRPLSQKICDKPVDMSKKTLTESVVGFLDSLF